MSGKGLTASNCSIAVEGVFIVVHVGTTALVKQLLVAAVVGMAAPRAGERRGSPEPGVVHLPPTETLIIHFISSRVGPSNWGPERAGYLPEVTQQGRASQCPKFLSMILPLCPMPRTPAFPLGQEVQHCGQGGGRDSVRSVSEGTDNMQSPYLAVRDGQGGAKF